MTRDFLLGDKVRFNPSNVSDRTQLGTVVGFRLDHRGARRPNNLDEVLRRKGFVEVKGEDGMVRSMRRSRLVLVDGAVL